MPSPLPLNLALPTNLPPPCSLMRQRFDSAESQLDGGEDEAPAELSLDSMTERLGRLDAAKAFYAALGESGGRAGNCKEFGLLAWLGCCGAHQHHRPPRALPLPAEMHSNSFTQLCCSTCPHSRLHVLTPSPPCPSLPFPAVARSHGFLQLEQQEPFGDITLRRGQYL